MDKLPPCIMGNIILFLESVFGGKGMREYKFLPSITKIESWKMRMIYV